MAVQRIEEKDVFMKVHLTFYKSGLSQRLGIYMAGILTAIASYMDENGECYPTQRQLAERTGMDTKTLNKHLNILLNVRVNGKPLITRKFVKGRAYSNSVYVVQPISQITIFNGKFKALETGFTYEVKEGCGKSCAL